MDIISPWAYSNKLPSQLYIQDIQSVSHLKKAVQNPLLYQQHEPPPLEIVDRKEEYEVDWIDNSRIFQRQLQYLIK